MRTIVILLLLAALAGLQGCALPGPNGGDVNYVPTTTAAGAATGGGVANLIVQLFPEASPLARGLATAGGIIGGGATGYVVGKHMNNKAAEEKAALQQQQQAQAYQQQMRQMAQNTRLSAPCYFDAGNNQYYAINNGPELGQYLMGVRPGTPFTLLTNRSSQNIVIQDMNSNGYDLANPALPEGKNVRLTFRKNSVQRAPVSLQEAQSRL